MPNMKMDNRKRARFETRANILKALAHPMRLFMLEELANKSYCVCELTEMVGLDISTVSKHLSILKNAGLVNVEKKGKHDQRQLLFPYCLTSKSYHKRIVASTKILLYVLSLTSKSEHRLGLLNSIFYLN